MPVRGRGAVGDQHVHPGPGLPGVETRHARLAGEVAVPVAFVHQVDAGFDDPVVRAAKVDRLGDDAQPVAPSDGDESAGGVVAGHPEPRPEPDEGLVQVNDPDAQDRGRVMVGDVPTCELGEVVSGVLSVRDEFLEREVPAKLLWIRRRRGGCAHQRLPAAWTLTAAEGRVAKANSAT